MVLGNPLETGYVIEQIAEKSQKQSDEIRRLVEEKKKCFSGILTDSGAAFMVAKDLGIDLGRESVKRMHISQLKAGMQNVDLLVRAMQVFSPKPFEKNGRSGKLCNLVVADSTGEIRLTVWHDDVKKLAREHVQRGSVLLLRNCYVKSFNEKLQISLASNGRMEVNPKNVLFADLPEAKTALSKISGLQEGMNDANVVARVIRLFPVTLFEKEQRKGSVMNFLIGDETGITRATAWNDLVKEVQALKENHLVRIEGAYTKQGLKGIELHLGWQARIGREPENNGIPSAGTLMMERAERKKVVGLAVGDANVLVEGKIVAVNQGALYYSVCPKCGGKVQRFDEGIVCDKCGEVKEPDIRHVVSIRIDDGSAQIDAVAYGSEAEKIMGLGKEDLKKQAAERGREALLEELQAMNGKKISVVGKVKENSFSNQIELVASAVELK